MKLHYVQHHDDEGVDEIIVLVEKHPFMRCAMIPRYKTSGLSGDEWRVSAMWEHEAGGLWAPLDGPYGKLEPAIAAIFPGVYRSHKQWHTLACTSIRLYRKGRPVIEMTDNGKPQPLLIALGHLPWTWRIWPEQLPPDAPGYFGGDVTQDLCFQVGCKAPAVSTYAFKKRYRRDGSERSAENKWSGRDATRFCEKHLRRGDCGLDDADRNYEVIEGPGPNEHKTPRDDLSASKCVVVDI